MVHKVSLHFRFFRCIIVVSCAATATAAAAVVVVVGRASQAAVDGAPTIGTIVAGSSSVAGSESAFVFYDTGEALHFFCQLPIASINYYVARGNIVCASSFSLAHDLISSARLMCRSSRGSQLSPRAFAGSCWICVRFLVCARSPVFAYNVDPLRGVVHTLTFTTFSSFPPPFPPPQRRGCCVDASVDLLLPPTLCVLLAFLQHFTVSAAICAHIIHGREHTRAHTHTYTCKRFHGKLLFRDTAKRSERT